MRKGDDHQDPSRNIVLRLCRRFLPLTETYEQKRFFVRREGKLLFTPLFVVLLVVETTDILFATDSIPAILAITPQQLSPAATDSMSFASGNTAALLTLNVSPTQPIATLTLGTVSPTDAQLTINVYDSTGALVRSFTGTSGGSIDLSSLVSGTYSVIVTSSNVTAGTAQISVVSLLPALAQCAAPQYGLYIAGSPAAQSAFTTTIAADAHVVGGGLSWTISTWYRQSPARL